MNRIVEDPFQTIRVEIPAELRKQRGEGRGRIRRQSIS